MMESSRYLIVRCNFIIIALQGLLHVQILDQLERLVMYRKLCVCVLAGLCVK